MWKIIKKSEGFTLLELVISMGIFLTVLVTASTMFVSMLQSQQRILAEQKLISETDYAVEYMSRALRMAKKDTDGSCLSWYGGQPSDFVGKNYRLIDYDRGGIVFLNNNYSTPLCDTFVLGNNGILYEISTLLGRVAITSEGIQITNIESPFRVFGDDIQQQPRVSINLNAQAIGVADPPRKIIQTTISQRNLNASQQ